MMKERGLCKKGEGNELLKNIAYHLPIFFISGIIDSIGGGGGLIALPTYLMIGLPVRSAYGCNKLQAGLGNLVSAIKYF